MKKNQYKKKMLLRKGPILTLLFVIALFSVTVFTSDDSNAANFKYSEFDWETFAEENKTYWEGYCQEGTEEEQEDCNNEILKSQEKFYKKLYKILAKYEKQGLFINDNIILETVFFELTPSTFSDTGEEYKTEWESNSGAYVVDESDLEDPNIEVDYSNADAAQYYADEKDTLKTLINNMIAYNTKCYGVYGNPTEHEAEDGSKYYRCDNGGSLESINGHSKCADTLLNPELGFWKYYVSKWMHDETLPLRLDMIPFLGLTPVDEYYTQCMNYASSYPEETTYVYMDNKHVSVQRYWEFLHYNKYFDNKAHLQEHFRETVLDPADVDCLTNAVCDNSLEAAGLYDQYELAIQDARKEIIDDIIDILKEYGIDAPYDKSESQEFIEMNETQAERKSFYWPIGSDETEERDGIIYADKDPASTEVISYFGNRTNQVTGEEEFHYGIDISGVDGSTNVIAVYTGEVISVVNNCTNGDYDCNDGYGNMIVLSHSNGDYTVYAHLASIHESVVVGSSVQRGQLIGKVGSTGRTLVASLHYELRVGGNDITCAVDPLGTMSVDNPRPTTVSGDFSVHTTSLTKEEFVSKMRSYCNSRDCSSTFLEVFLPQAEMIYNVSVANNVNPELVVIRAFVEGFSPGRSRNNYWGIGCTNEGGLSACHSYSSFEEGIKGFANTVKNYETASDMMQKYAYIGKYWYNPGNWSLGGCKYFPYIQEYMSAERASVVSGVCNSGSSCESGGVGNCTLTTDEDQTAYAVWQVNKKMGPLRYNIFGL